MATNSIRFFKNDLKIQLNFHWRLHQHSNGQESIRVPLDFCSNKGNCLDGGWTSAGTSKRRCCCCCRSYSIDSSSINNRPRLDCRWPLVFWTGHRRPEWHPSPWPGRDTFAPLPISARRNLKNCTTNQYTLENSGRNWDWWRSSPNAHISRAVWLVHTKLPISKKPLRANKILRQKRGPISGTDGATMFRFVSSDSADLLLHFLFWAGTSIWKCGAVKRRSLSRRTSVLYLSCYLSYNIPVCFLR